MAAPKNTALKALVMVYSLLQSRLGKLEQVPETFKYIISLPIHPNGFLMESLGAGPRIGRFYPTRSR